MSVSYLSLVHIYRILGKSGGSRLTSTPGASSCRRVVGRGWPRVAAVTSPLGDGGSMELTDG